jgi:cyclopropane-fatty-acyl-phospholipid synthase
MSDDRTASLPTRSRIAWLDRCARSGVHRVAKEIADGSVTLRDSDGTVAFGAPGGLSAAIDVRDPRFYRRALLGGSVAVAESYLAGEWECDDLTALVRLFLRNEKAFLRLDSIWSVVARQAYRCGHALRRNTRAGSRANIRAHYDLGNDFFGMWLDETLAYSSGIFLSPASSLEEASTEKFDRVCRKLELQADDRVLEIGCGWGGFAVHAAKNYGCRVDAATISRAQYEFARKRVKDAGVADRVCGLLSDYRDLTGQYDKLASIEMIEAVGHRNFDAFFRKCDSLLAEDGRCVLQAIVLPDQYYAGYLKTADFIQRHVFPGGCLASIGALSASAGASSDLFPVHVEESGLHYAETLRRWRERFVARIDDVRRLGYPASFLRLWTYYLSYCEAAFAERQTGVVQLRFEKRARQVCGSRVDAPTKFGADASSPLRRWTSTLGAEFVELPFQWES